MNIKSNGAHKHRILLLGEGNFSFALSLYNRLVETGLDADIYATAFDDENELYRKYPESRRIITLLRRQAGIDEAEAHRVQVQVLFNFDATRDYRQQLSHIAAKSVIGEDGLVLFDSVVFNFPHLGVEDARAHGSMVAHCMHAARGVLRPPARMQSGLGVAGFFLCLADAQHARWDVSGAALRNGLTLASSPRFRPSDWSGYEIKRHINGKGFHSRVDACSYFFYVPFRKADEAGDGGGEEEEEGDGVEARRNGNALLSLLHSQSGAEKSIAKKTPDKKHSAVANEGAPQSGIAESVNASGRDAHEAQKKKKRKVHALTDGLWRAVSASAGVGAETKADIETETETGLSSVNGAVGGADAMGYQCLQCLRQFPVHQAVVEHVYNVHVMAAQDTQSVASARSSEYSHLPQPSAPDVAMSEGGGGGGGDDDNDNDDDEDEERSDQPEPTAAAEANACGLCTRSFSSARAVQAHRLSVHGRFEVPKPRWAAQSQSQSQSQAQSQARVSEMELSKSDPPSLSAGTDFHSSAPNECAICGLAFPSEDALSAHVERGMQPRSFEESTEESSLLQCACGRRFSEERALRQHQNLCSRDKPVPDLLQDDFSFEDPSAASAATAAAVNVKDKKRFIKHAEVQASTDDILDTFPDEKVQPALDVLSTRVSAARLSKFDSILNTRTNAIRFVFENPANVNNCYAALRTFDAVGVQYADIIVQPDQYVDSGRLVKMKSSMGALKWMSITQYSDTRTCLLALKAQGYLIVVTDIHRAGSIPIDQVDFSSSKLAIVLGNEQFGTSELAKDLSDVCFYLPMAGFAESLNLAAFCALLCGRLQVSGALQVRNSVRDGTIPPSDKNRILLKWMERSLPPGNALRMLQAEGLCGPS